MSTFVSVLNILEDPSKFKMKDLREIFDYTTKQVSEGRYFISVFDAPNNWNSRISVESLVIEHTMGAVNSRKLDWEFYGNGAIRCYDENNKELVRTLQWNIVRRSGPKPYKKRHTLSKTDLDTNEIPVEHKVFTRDVANNVWHLSDKTRIPRLIARFSSLLCWNDEVLEVIMSGRKIEIPNQKKLDLSYDLVGVPTKVLYDWKTENRLF